jgi:hypothetical protein
MRSRLGAVERCGTRHRRAGYAKVTTLEEAQRQEMREWIEQAGDVPGWR